MLQHLSVPQARLETPAAAQYGGRRLRIRFEIPLAFLGRPAEDTVIRAGNDVRDAVWILFVEDETLDAGVSHAYDLAPDRLHRSVVYQIPGPESDAVDDRARIHLVE